MAEKLTDSSLIVRTERGLSLAGTRITLYDIMEYLEAGWPPRLIQHWLNLTEQQIADAPAYITAHRDTVEAEYQLVLEHAEANRHYWEERNRERFEQIAKLPPKPGYEAVYARLQREEPRVARNDSGARGSHIEGQALLLWSALATSGWLDFDLVRLMTFADTGLPFASTDRAVWRFVQEQGMLLLTGNRNMDGADSLEQTIREENHPAALPVITIARPDRIIERSIVKPVLIV